MMFDHEPLLLVSTLAWPLLLTLALTMTALRPTALQLVPTAAVPALLTALLPSSQYELSLPWLLLGSGLGLDEMSTLYLLFSSILWTAGGMALPGTNRVSFCFWFLLTMAANFSLLLARDIPLFFLSYAVMSLASFGLVFHRRTKQAKHAAIVYLVFVIIGEMVLLAAMILVAHNAATLDLEYIVDRTPQDLLIALLLIGFGIKAGLPLLHMALPCVYAVTPLAAAIPMAGALLHLGLYGWMRFLPLGQTALPEWSAAIACIGTIAVIYGIAVGLAQRAARSLLAYSSISQTGLMLLGLSMGLASPEHWQLIQPILLLYALHHALVKGALFNGLGSFGWRGVSLWLPALALAGLPFTGGALVKGMLKAQVHMLPESWPAIGTWILLLSSVGTTLLMTRFLYLTFSKEPQQEPTSPVSQWVLLLAMLVLPWFWSLPLERFNPLWSALWPVALAASIGWLVYNGVFKHLLSLVPSLPAGDLLIPLEMLLQRIPWFHAKNPTHHQVHETSTTSAGMPVPIATAEHFMGRWQVAVGLLVILMLAIVFLLMES